MPRALNRETSIRKLWELQDFYLGLTKLHHPQLLNPQLVLLVPASFSAISVSFF
jgi:hypothetical protein